MGLPTCLESNVFYHLYYHNLLYLIDHQILQSNSHNRIPLRGLRPLCPMPPKALIPTTEPIMDAISLRDFANVPRTSNCAVPVLIMLNVYQSILLGITFFRCCATFIFYCLCITINLHCVNIIRCCTIFPCYCYCSYFSGRYATIE